MIAYQRRNGAAYGTLVAAVWLIGLGLVFLIQEANAWTWGEAWPLFVILAGAASLTTSLLGYRRLAAGAWSLVWHLGWIVVGVLLLLSTTGALGTDPADLFTRWWPVVLIAIGVWCLVAAVWPGGTRASQSLAVPLVPGTPSAEVRIKFGGGRLAVGRAAPGMFVAGTFGGGVSPRQLSPSSIELSPYTAGGWGFWWDRPLEWSVGLTGEVPLDLRVDGGASRSTLDLGDLQVRHLELHTGASETLVTLPRQGGTSVRAETGAASLTVTVPDGVAARIRARMAIGGVTVNEARFPRSMDGFESADYATNPRRTDIDVQGGVGAVRIN